MEERDCSLLMLITIMAGVGYDHVYNVCYNHVHNVYSPNLLHNKLRTSIFFFVNNCKIEAMHLQLQIKSGIVFFIFSSALEFL